MDTNGKREKDSLGTRMKEFYENRTRFMLGRRSYTLIRIDGKAFHTYTRGLMRPFDAGLMSDMDETTKYLCKNIQGAKFGYVQSDEISILVTDFDDLKSESWFDLNLQKMCSVSASLATSKFNHLRLIRSMKEKEEMDISYSSSFYEKMKLAEFDSRVFQITLPIEVENYFIWRQQDATRNSISSSAQAVCSHKDLHGKTSDQQLELLFQKGINWNDYSAREKRGGFIERVMKVVDGKNPMTGLEERHVRNSWEAVECPIFTAERDFLKSLIPE